MLENSIKVHMIYIYCPMNSVTGGPESLHTLFFELNKLTPNVRMYYYNNKLKLKNPVPPKYSKYSIKWVSEIEDSLNNIFIIPEIIAHKALIFKNAKVYVWWLSVDNYYKSNGLFLLKYKSQSLKTLFKKTLKYNFGIIVSFIKHIKFIRNKKITHLVGSFYAKSTLEKSGAKNIENLKQTISKTFLERQNEIIDNNKEDIILYNPKKGYRFTKKIIYNNKTHTFLPLKNYSELEVFNLMNKAKVYIDFGNFPGPERLPREAVISNCIIITGKQGASKYYNDVTISENYKFTSKIKNIKQISNLIEDIFVNYTEHLINMQDYKKKVKQSYNEFLHDIKDIFKEYIN